MEISIVIPAYNEEGRLGDTLDRILSYMSGKGHGQEIIVVDDGSRDGTVFEAEKFSGNGVRILRNDRNRGKGYSVRHGMLDARKPFVLFSDADLSTPIEELEELAKPIRAGLAEVVIGSRSIEGSIIEVSQPVHRVAMGKFYNLLVRMIAMGELRDTQCGFKLFTRHAAQEVFRRQRLAGFGFDVEVLVIARHLGFRIVEIPVRWIDCPETKVDLLRDSTKMFLDLFNVRWNLLCGKYR